MHTVLGEQPERRRQTASQSVETVIFSKLCEDSSSDGTVGEMERNAQLELKYLFYSSGACLIEKHCAQNCEF